MVQMKQLIHWGHLLLIITISIALVDLDENNGRYCVTPDYPNGVYAYFITISAGGTPVFPYILGERFYSIPVESNYNSSINQLNVPSKARRLKTSITPNNGVAASASY